MTSVIRGFAIVALTAGVCTAAYAEAFDLVIKNGRVMDPETGQLLIAGKELMRLCREKTERLKDALGHEGPNLRWDA